MQEFNASRARRVIEHCLGGALQHTLRGSAIAGAAVDSAEGAKDYSECRFHYKSRADGV